MKLSQHSPWPGPCRAWKCSCCGNFTWSGWVIHQHCCWECSDWLYRARSVNVPCGTPDFNYLGRDYSWFLFFALVASRFFYLFWVIFGKVVGCALLWFSPWLWQHGLDHRAPWTAGAPTTSFSLSESYAATCNSECRAWFVGLVGESSF